MKEIEYELNVLERLAILNILPQENNFATLKIIRDLKSNIGITEDEFTKFELVMNGEQLRWNAEGSKRIPFKIGMKARDIIVEQLKELDDQDKLNENHITIYELFVEGE